MSGLMVSLAVVVVAILALLFVVFSDQPATAHARRLLRGRGAGFSTETSAGAGKFHRAPRRGPPPARVLQHQLALPASRPRTHLPAGAGPVQPTAPRAATATEASAVASAAGPVPAGFVLADDRTMLRRIRSSIALFVVLTVVGAGVAILIGIALFLASVAIRNTVG